MAKALLLAALFILLALAACSGPSPTTVVAPTAAPLPSEPTGTPTTALQPATTPKATPVQFPTLTPEPTSPPTREGETPTGVLSPLNLHDTEDANSELSEAELACLKDASPGLHLGWAFTLPGYGDPQERVEIIGCLKDETVARIFVAESAEGVPTLSLETSTCVRAAFNEIDPRSMMLAKVEGFPEGTLNSATTVRFVTMACLNDAEWKTAAEWVREDSEIRKVMQCVMEKLGGPGEMAVAMTKGGRGDQELLAEAAAGCAEALGPAPSEAVPAPMATPQPASASEPSNIVPLDPDNAAELFSWLSQEERDCITDVELLLDFWSYYTNVDYEDVAQQLGCLGDETLLNLHLAQLAWYFQDLGRTLMADTAACIRESLDGISMGDLVREAHTAKPSLVRQMHNAVSDLTFFYCLSEEEVALAAPDSGITGDEYDGMICTVDAFGGLEEFVEAYRNTGTEEFTEMLLTNLYSCPGG